VYNFSGGWNDQSRIFVEYRDVATTILSTYDTGYRSSLSWTNYTDVRIAPVGTRTIRIRLVSSRNVGTAADGYFDDLVLTHSTTLPVNLVLFTADQKSTSIEVNWQTSKELNNDNFILEKSENAIDWIALDTQKGLVKSESIVDYQYSDFNPNIGIQYYRLTQIDINGTPTIYSIVAVDFSNGELPEFEIYPNPTSVFVEISGLTEIEKLELYNASGLLVYTSSAFSNKTIVNTGNFISGLYSIVIYTGNSKVVKKLIIE
jgi:hypothetical protein